MKILYVLAFSLLSLFLTDSKNSKICSYPSINNIFPLLWKAEIGKASFRTNILLQANTLLIGSNGEYFTDWSYVDRKSGIYSIDLRNGKIKFASNGNNWGDFDVNGLLIYEDRVFYGNDNEEFLCEDLNGKIIWRNLASGDVEAEPKLIDIKGRKTIVYATELGEVRAVDPINGHTIWSYYTPEFKGWKGDDSRRIFKVKAFLASTESFFTKPVLVDINNDQVLDLVYVGYDDTIYCISGLNGKLLWRLKNRNVETQFGLSIELRVVNNELELWVPSGQYDIRDEKISISITRISKQGKNLGIIPLYKTDFFDISINSFESIPGHYFYASKDSLFLIKNSIVSKSIYFGENYKSTYSWNNLEYTDCRNYDEQLFGTSLFNYKGLDSCFLILSQRDRLTNNNGFITILSLKDWKVVGKYALPDLSEMQPQIMDINSDGKLELLVNCFDGNLYCYQLN